MQMRMVFRSCREYIDALNHKYDTGEAFEDGLNNQYDQGDNL